MKETKLSYVVAGSKPRIIAASITPQDQDTFSIAGAQYKANRFRLKMELGVVLGMMATITGKKPAETDIWVVASDVPAFVKFGGPFYPGGPVWRVEMTSPVWPGAPPSKH